MRSSLKLTIRLKNASTLIVVKLKLYSVISALTSTFGQKRIRSNSLRRNLTNGKRKFTILAKRPAINTIK